MRLNFCSKLQDRPRIARTSAVGVAKPPVRVNIPTRRAGSVRSNSPFTRGSMASQKSFSRSSALRFHPTRVSDVQLEPRQDVLAGHAILLVQEALIVAAADEN